MLQTVAADYSFFAVRCDSAFEMDLRLRNRNPCHVANAGGKRKVQERSFLEGAKRKEPKPGGHETLCAPGAEPLGFWALRPPGYEPAQNARFWADVMSITFEKASRLMTKRWWSSFSFGNIEEAV
jgi:hypothetical protein